MFEADFVCIGAAWSLLSYEVRRVSCIYWTQSWKAKVYSHSFQLSVTVLCCPNDIIDRHVVYEFVKSKLDYFGSVLN